MIAGTRPPAVLDRAAVATRLGVEPESVTQYLYRTRQRLTENRPLRIWDMPLPDGYIGQSPWWYESTIAAWLASRPGQGVGGGRPRKTTDEEQTR